MNELHIKIGKLLKVERERQGKTLEELSTQLKITVTNLEHIEQGDAKALPSELYFNLFAKSYAEALGIDYTATVEAIKEDLGEPIETPTQSKTGKKSEPAKEASRPKAEPQEQPQEEKEARNFWRYFAFLFGGIIVIFLIVLVLYKLFSSSEETSHPETAPPETTTEITEPAESPSEGTSPYANYNWQTPSYHKPQEMSLRLIAKQETWATVLADGDTAVFRTLTPGRTYNVTAKYRFLVSIAWPSRVTVELNGKTVNLRNPATGRISQVEITQVNIDSILNAPQPAQGNPTFPKFKQTSTAAPQQSQTSPDTSTSTTTTRLTTPSTSSPSSADSGKTSQPGNNPNDVRTNDGLDNER